MVSMGYSRKDIEDSLAQNKYDNLTATYLLLGHVTNDVGVVFSFLSWQTVFRLISDLKIIGFHSV